MITFVPQGKNTCVSEGIEDFSLELESPSHGLYTLNAPGGLVLRSKHVTLDGLEESTALPDHPRIHQSEDGGEAQFESASTIPFGAEPSIRRKFRLLNGFLGITTDLVIRSSFKVSQIGTGGFTLGGPIRKLTLLAAGSSAVPEKILDKPFSDIPDGVLYEGICPPVSVIAEAEDSSLLELITGEDFWRWTASGKGESSSYRLIKKDSSLSAEWILYSWKAEKPGEEPPPGRNRRINFSITWRKGGFSFPHLPKKAKVFDLRSFEWPTQLLVSGPSGENTKDPCISSSGAVNILKKFVRKNLKDLKKGDVLALTNVSVALCSCAAHQDRARMRVLPHLDLYAFVDFRRWAEKQLAPSGAKFMLIPAKDSVFAQSAIFRQGEK